MSLTENVIKLIFLQHGHRKKKKCPQNGERENKKQEPSHPFPLKKIHGEKMIIPVSQMTILRVREAHRPSCFGPCEKKKSWRLGKKLAPQSQGRLKRGDGKARLLPSCLGVIPD